MAFNQKIVRLGQDIIDSLTIHGMTVTLSLDASQDVCLTVDNGVGDSALIKLEKVAQLGNNQANPVTGLVEEVFTPHVTKVGFDSGDAGVQASDTATLLAALTAGDKVTINGHDFTSIDSGAAGDQWNITGTTSSGTVTVGADLTAGDKITLNGHDFTSIDSGAAGDQWNITGVNATGTIQLVTVANGNTVIIQGITFTATAATQDANGNFINNASMIVAAANLATAINANVTTSALVTAANGGTDTVTITAIKKGTSGNAFTLADGNSPTHYIRSGATLTGGSVNTTTCATSLAAAIAGSGTAGITGIVTAASALAVVTITGVKKGTSGNVTLVAVGGATHLLASGATLTGGAIDLTATAATLANEIATSATAGILNVVTATSSGPVVTIKASSVGVAGNAVTVTQTGGHITVATATLTGGTNATVGGTSEFLKTVVTARIVPNSTGFVVYDTPGITFTDLSNNSFIVVSIRNIPFGILAQM